MELWELLQIEVLQSNFQNVGTITNQSFTVKFSKCGNYYKSKFYSQTFKMWELLQIEVLQSNFQNVGTITNHGFYEMNLENLMMVMMLIYFLIICKR